jgi:site-specific DNA recombinase
MKFAILCRVSTDSQANEGESLAVQKLTLQKCVDVLGGVIIKEFIGQEHSTEGHERPILDEILSDCSKGLFDALMVYDLSRLTRDPIKSKIILANLKKNGIKLYVQTQLYSLDNPETNLVLGLLSEINAFQAAIQVQKSVESKIELAKKGWWVVGNAPFARRLASGDRTKPPEWILDEEKALLAQKIYDLYINQRFYVEKIEKVLGIDDALIYRILKDKALFRQSFNWNNGVVETLTPLPALFTPEQSEMIRERLKTNKKSNGTKYEYLLKGLVKCQVCGYTFVGFTSNQGKNSYYNHSRHKITADCLKWVHKKPLEKAVLDSISELISSNELLMETIKQCNQSSIQRRDTLEQEIDTLSVRQDKLEKRKSKAVKLVLDGVFTEEEVAKEMEKVRKELVEVSIELLSKKTELEGLSSEEVPEEVLERISYTFDCLRGQYGKDISQWEFSIKRLLIEWFFGISKQSGVWIRGADKEVLYTIKSNLGTLAFGWLGNDSDAGQVGQTTLNERVKDNATLNQFLSIVESITFSTKPCLCSSTKFDAKSWSRLKVEMTRKV